MIKLISCKNLKIGFPILLFIFLASPLEGRIFSTQQLNAQLNGVPSLVPLQSEGENNVLLNRFRRYVEKQHKRATPMMPTHKTSSLPKLDSTEFDLGNDTTHNQALIHWSGKNSMVIFILTRRKESAPGGPITHSTLWRSQDYGKTYVKENHKFHDKAVLKSYFVCPTNKSKVIFVDSYKNINRVWSSRDEGETYQPYNTSFSLDKIEFHPEKQDWILGYDKAGKGLYASMDLGMTWSKLHDKVTSDRYYWYIKDVDVGENAERIVHFEYRNMKVFPERVFFLKSCYIPNCTVTLFQKECDALGSIDMESLVVQDNYTFAQKSGTKEKLYVSYNRQPFVKAQFPGNTEQTEFHIVSSDGKTVVVGVNHENALSDLFFSDILGQQFVLSLANVRYFGRKSGDDFVFNVDIHEVKAVAGAFITNKQTSTRQNETMITWDNGRSWTHLSVPSLDADGRAITRCSGCHLNLHCQMSQTKSGYYMPAMMSKETIPGLIIAHGSYSRSLVDAPSLVNVYVSNDAGMTWVEALKRRHLYIVADHGAIIVAVQMIFLRPVMNISFSNDIGATWTSHKFSNATINVDGLLTEPGEYTHKFTLFGHKNYRDHWKLFALDLAPLIDRNCTYPSDFTNWTASPNPNKTKCHLGMIQTIERHRSTHCLIGAPYKRFTSKTPCECTEADYECAFGYVPSASFNVNGGCSKIHPHIDWIDDIVHDEKDDYLPSVPPTLCINGTRKISTPFRRVPGDQCVNDLAMKLYTTESCTATEPPPTTKAPSVQLELLNTSFTAQIGEPLLFSVHTSSEVQWSLELISEPVVFVPTAGIKHQNTDGTVSLSPNKPGDYAVRAYSAGDPSVSDTVMVSFWYPIEEVVILYPPVVEVNTPYNATAVVVTKFGLRGTNSMLGGVSYSWDTDSASIIQKTNFISLTHTTIRDHSLAVTATNTISHRSARGKVVVKEYVETLVLPLVSSRPLNESMLTDEWLTDLTRMLTTEIFNIKAMALVLTSQGLVNGHNFHVFITPTLPLSAKLFFSPSEQGIPSKENLLKAATTLENLIGGKSIVMHLPHNVLIVVGTPYVVDDKGTHIGLSKAMSAGYIVLIVLLTILLVVIGLLLARKYAKNARWSAYFTLRNRRHISLRSSHIVRSRPTDCAPIVEDEFIDDELDNMEVAPNDLTLQFQG